MKKHLVIQPVWKPLQRHCIKREVKLTQKREHEIRAYGDRGSTLHGKPRNSKHIIFLLCMGLCTCCFTPFGE